MIKRTEVPGDDFSISLTLDGAYRFLADAHLPGVDPFVIDEGPPLGESTGPSPSRVLAAAMAGCLGMSLLFCLQKSRVPVQAMTIRAAGTMTRNEKGRLRIASVRIRLHPVVAPEHASRMARCVELFEDFCIVSESVRKGIDVDVSVGT